MDTRPFLLHALSSLHAGTGFAADIIDLPIARMKATGIPFVPGSSIKGVLRDLRCQIDREKTEAVFGPSENPEAHAGALVVSDARLLALPVRSFRGTFAWVTSPLLLILAQRDLCTEMPIPTPGAFEANVVSGNVCTDGGKIYLEDLDLKVSDSASAAVKIWAECLAPLLFPGDTGPEQAFVKRFVVVDDETLSFLSDTATQVDARVRLDEKTRTVARGALWLEESLPSETLLVGLLAAERSRRPGVAMNPDAVLDYALGAGSKQILQLGGRATIGRGRCRLIPYQSGKDAAHVNA